MWINEYTQSKTYFTRFHWRVVYFKVNVKDRACKEICKVDGEQNSCNSQCHESLTVPLNYLSLLANSGGMRNCVQHFLESESSTVEWGLKTELVLPYQKNLNTVISTMNCVAFKSGPYPSPVECHEIQKSSFITNWATHSLP